MITETSTPTKEELIARLSQLIGGLDNAKLWLNTPHPLIGGRTPQSYLDEGDLKVLSYFVHAIETGQPS